VSSRNRASVLTAVLQKIEWKFECRGDGCWCVSLAYDDGQRQQTTKWLSGKVSLHWHFEERVLQVPLFQGKVGFHENRRAQSKADQSYFVLDYEDVGCRTTWRIAGVLSQLQGPGGPWHHICAFGQSRRCLSRGIIQVSTIRFLLDAHLLHCWTPRSGNAAFHCAPDPGRFAYLSFTCLCKAERAAGGNRNQDAKAKRNLRRHLLRQGSRRGELPGSGVTSSTPHRAGQRIQDPAEPSSQPPTANQLVAGWTGSIH